MKFRNLALEIAVTACIALLFLVTNKLSGQDGEFHYHDVSHSRTGNQFEVHSHRVWHETTRTHTATTDHSTDINNEAHAGHTSWDSANHEDEWRHYDQEHTHSIVHSHDNYVSHTHSITHAEDFLSSLTIQEIDGSSDYPDLMLAHTAESIDHEKIDHVQLGIATAVPSSGPVEHTHTWSHIHVTNRRNNPVTQPLHEHVVTHSHPLPQDHLYVGPDSLHETDSSITHEAVARSSQQSQQQQSNDESETVIFRSAPVAEDVDGDGDIDTGDFERVQARLGHAEGNTPRAPAASLALQLERIKLQACIRAEAERRIGMGKTSSVSG